MTTSFPVLSSPPEIRALIFRDAVTFAHPLVRLKTNDKRESLAPQLGLLLASKTVHEEAAALFYELNTFRFVLAIPRRNGDPYDSDEDSVVDSDESDSEDSRDPQSDPEPSATTERTVAGALTVPTRYLNRLRSVIFHKRIAGYWPNGPLRRDREDLGEAELALLLDRIAAQSGILGSVSIELQRASLVTSVQWDPDPLTLLKELDGGSRFGRIVAERTPELRRLEIWKGRKCHAEWMELSGRFPEGGAERGEVYVREVEAGVLERVRAGHFAGVKSARYERRGWGEYVQTQGKDADLFMKEGFVLLFT